MQLTLPLHKACIERPDGLMLSGPTGRRSFRLVRDRVARLAGALRALGVGTGDRVGILSLNSGAMVELVYAAWWAGAVVNPINVRWTAREVAFGLDDCETRVLAIGPEFAPMLNDIRESSACLSRVVCLPGAQASGGDATLEDMVRGTQPIEDAGRSGDDLAAILYTGGTTGRPKGVMLTHAGLFADTVGVIASDARPSDPVGLAVAPMFHVGGLALVLQLLVRLGTIVPMAVFDEAAILATIAAERVTETFLVPTMIKRLIEHPAFGSHDVSSLGYLLYGAAPMDPSLLERAMAAFPSAGFAQAYGMTELSPVVCILPRADHLGAVSPARLASAGRPIGIAQVAIRRVDDGAFCSPGEVGEIVARGPMVMRGYWNRPEETAAALRDGWMHTGDAGSMDRDGYVTILDRVKDMIITGGENVYSVEVENVILSMPGVMACGVVAVPDETWGERVHAVVVPKPGAALTVDDVLAFCRGRMAGYKCPRSAEVREALPMSPVGKVLKHELRRPFWQGRSRTVA